MQQWQVIITVLLVELHYMLAQQEITCIRDAAEVCDRLHSLGPGLIFLTTLDVSDATNGGSEFNMWGFPVKFNIDFNRKVCLSTDGGEFIYTCVLVLFVLDMVMYEELLICFISRCPAPLGAPSGGSKIRNLWHLKRCGTQFGFGWSNYRAEISVLECFREEKVVFFDFPDMDRHFFYGQHFHLTGNPHFSISNPQDFKLNSC